MSINHAAQLEEEEEEEVYIQRRGFRGTPWGHHNR
jgi:hypothetical protein